MNERNQGPATPKPKCKARVRPDNGRARQCSRPPYSDGAGHFCNLHLGEYIAKDGDIELSGKADRDQIHADILLYLRERTGDAKQNETGDPAGSCDGSAEQQSSAATANATRPSSDGSPGTASDDASAEDISTNAVPLSTPGADNPSIDKNSGAAKTEKSSGLTELFKGVVATFVLACVALFWEGLYLYPFGIGLHNISFDTENIYIAVRNLLHVSIFFAILTFVISLICLMIYLTGWFLIFLSKINYKVSGKLKKKTISVNSGENFGQGKIPSFIDSAKQIKSRVRLYLILAYWCRKCGRILRKVANKIWRFFPDNLNGKASDASKYAFAIVVVMLTVVASGFHYLNGRADFAGYLGMDHVTLADYSGATNEIEALVGNGTTASGEAGRSSSYFASVFEEIVVGSEFLFTPIAWALDRPFARDLAPYRVVIGNKNQSGDGSSGNLRVADLSFADCGQTFGRCAINDGTTPVSSKLWFVGEYGRWSVFLPPAIPRVALSEAPIPVHDLTEQLDPPVIVYKSAQPIMIETRQIMAMVPTSFEVRGREKHPSSQSAENNSSKGDVHQMIVGRTSIKRELSTFEAELKGKLSSIEAKLDNIPIGTGSGNGTANLAAKIGAITAILEKWPKGPGDPQSLEAAVATLKGEIGALNKTRSDMLLGLTGAMDKFSDGLKSALDLRGRERDEEFAKARAQLLETIGKLADYGGHLEGHGTSLEQHTDALRGVQGTQSSAGREVEVASLQPQMTESVSGQLQADTKVPGGHIAALEKHTAALDKFNTELNKFVEGRGLHLQGRLGAFARIPPSCRKEENWGNVFWNEKDIEKSTPDLIFPADKYRLRDAENYEKWLAKLEKGLKDRREEFANLSPDSGIDLKKGETLPFLLIVEGTADSRGNSDSNFKLAERRATSVHNWIQKRVLDQLPDDQKNKPKTVIVSYGSGEWESELRGLFDDVKSAPNHSRTVRVRYCSHNKMLEAWIKQNEAEELNKTR